MSLTQHTTIALLHCRPSPAPALLLRGGSQTLAAAYPLPPVFCFLPRLPPLAGGSGFASHHTARSIRTHRRAHGASDPGHAGGDDCRIGHGLASTQILKILIQNLSGPRSGENFSKPQWVPACWLFITPIPMVPQPHFPSLRRCAHAERFAKCPPRVLRAAQPRTQPRTRTYAVYPPLRLTALAKF